ncbi:MAG TPA: hypothetical protein VMR00_17175 [Streptosporangiaceae bacterium]|nr:hypothetical protein [Streptosporangiaceae bacterium]
MRSWPPDGAPAQVAALLTEAGFTVHARLLREPEASGNFPEKTQQGFVLACKPRGASDADVA